MSNIQVRQQEARNLVASRIKQLELITGDKKKASVYATAISEMAVNKNLQNCSVESIVHTAMSIVQAGLNPNPIFNEAYVVPFRTKGGEVAQLQIGVKGYVTLGYRAGWVFKTRPVYKCDEFEVRLDDFDEEYKVVPNYSDRQEDDGDWVHKNLVGVLVLAKDKRGNIFKEFVPFDKLEKIRLKSQNQKSKDSLSYIWREWAIEMYQAKALKYVIKRLPISDDVIEIIAEDEKFEVSGGTKEKQQDIKPDFGFGKKVEQCDTEEVIDVEDGGAE